MTPERIAELRRLADAATKGPWTAKEPAFAPGIKARVFGPTYKGKFDGQETMAVPDADFISAARNALPELLDALDEAEAKIKRLTAHLKPGYRTGAVSREFHLQLVEAKDAEIAALRAALDRAGEP